jgi:hypothetical protein
LDLDRFHAYVGVDVSDIAVENAIRRYPAHSFIRADLAAETEPDVPEADVVVCLDVLIHQLHADAYQRMVRRIVEHTRRVGLVTGYETRASEPEFASEITAFHEPLSETLARAGAVRLTKVGQYRGLTAITFQR